MAEPSLAHCTYCPQEASASLAEPPSNSPRAKLSTLPTPKAPLSPLAHQKYYDSPGKKLLFDFLETFLSVEIIGFQSRFGYGSDLILFRAHDTGSTLAVECSVMLLPHWQALALVNAKIEANNAAFRRSA